MQRCGVGPVVRSTDWFWCGFTVTGWSPAGECQNRARSPAGNGCTAAVPNISLMHTLRSDSIFVTQLGCERCILYFSVNMMLVSSSHFNSFVSVFSQEIPENAADIAHLAHLHTPGIVSGVDLRYTNSKTWEFIRHDWKV